jgi:hypothetical protein
VYLVPVNVNERLKYACGKWFAPPIDRYTIWLEQGNRISDQTVINSAGIKFSDNGVVVLMPLNDAGFAAIAPDVTIDGQKTVRFLSVESSEASFEKRLQSSEAHSTNRLPAGKAIAGVFDADGEAIALSRPFTTKAGQTTLVSPQPPARGTDLMLVLAKRRATQHERTSGKAKIQAMIGGNAQEPDLLYENNGRIVAIWYALTAKTAALKLTSNVFLLDEKEIRLVPGTVTTIREELNLSTGGVIR